MKPLIAFIFAYMLVSIAIGLYAARRVQTTTDYALAGRRLPLFMIVVMTFATWFGSELVLGVSAEFVQGGLIAVIKDPFGAGLCLVLVGLFFARKLYRKSLLTLCDYYRQRFGSFIEVVCAIIIIFSYLGWVAAQVTALGLVFNMLSEGSISMVAGMCIGTAVVLVYTLFGGLWSVALTDLVQMIMIVIGLLLVAWYAADLAGGAQHVVSTALAEGKLQLFPELGDGTAWLFFIASLITMMLGSIPQQDVFQRVMSANNEDSAARGPIIGGIAYIIFGFVPMFIAMAAVLTMPEESARMMADDPQYILPTLILGHMPFALQVLFFGALLSAIMSTASATLLAPSTTFMENVLRNIKPGMNDKQTLLALRVSVVAFTILMLIYAITMEGKSIYDLVAEAYQLPLVGAFVPLVFGLYWQRATTQGAVFAVVFGIASWAFFSFSDYAEQFPPQLVGVLFAAIAMIAGSLMPQFIKDTKGAAHHLEESAA